ncbi:transposase [Streptomyces noursei]|uniref:Transposase IS116/IS110/IS902 C-terminal domain-containing protein n=1 Tax=Streptomyces noursei TaxID=1971 RepID=A0A2N8P8E5_STRNR|nr:transposase [Streptomyces noursei]PNE37294.1 hypothetical protein AOB60_23340 [Streptomyces noursei]
MARQNAKAEVIHLRSAGADLGKCFLPACARTPGDARIAGLLGGGNKSLDHFDTIPGIGRLTAETIIAETGGGMVRCPTAGRLASWAGVPDSGRDQAERRRRRR